MSKQEKVMKLYNFIKDNFYLSRPDLKIGTQAYNSHLLYSLLTQLNNGTQLIFGSWGTGKTAAQKYQNTLSYGLPLEVIQGAIIRGSPQITREDVIGRPDYGKMSQGEEEVRWQKFCLIPPKIWDEIDKTPEGTQAIALAGIEEGSWTYLNGHILEGRRPFYATANYASRGSYNITEALLDRMDIATATKFPGLVNTDRISRRYNREQEELLKDENIAKEAIGILLSKDDYEKIHNNLNPLRKEFLGKLNKANVPILKDEEKLEINKEIGKINFDELAELYCTLLTAELNIPARGNYLRSFMDKSLESRRVDQAVVRYAQALAWLQNKDKVTLEYVLAVAPYALWHKVKWNDNILGNTAFASYRDRGDLELIVTKKLLNEGVQNVKGLKTRLLENRENIEEMRNLIEKNDEENLKKKLEEITVTGGTHPYFTDLRREMEDFEE